MEPASGDNFQHTTAVAPDAAAAAPPAAAALQRSTADGSASLG